MEHWLDTRFICAISGIMELVNYRETSIIYKLLYQGGMAEWLKAAVLKTVRGESLSWVRILLPPPPRVDSKRFTGKILKTGTIKGTIKNRIVPAFTNRY